MTESSAPPGASEPTPDRSPGPPAPARPDEPPPPPQPSTSSRAEWPDRAGAGPGLTFGAILIVVGLLLLAGQTLDIGIADLGWPLIVVGIGVAILVIGLASGRESGTVIGGTVATTVGLVLAFQDATGLWSTWAYAWALVGPAASGLGLALYGLRTGSRDEVRNGTWGLLGGLAVFAVGFLFFEGIIGLSGDRLPIADWVLPVVVIGIGGAVLVRALLQRSDEGSTAA